jgi:hypothetical protein
VTDYKTLLGYIAVIVGIVSYIPYFKNIFAGKTKPHAFSWLVWSVLTSIAFAVQIVEGGGTGAWVTGTTAIICFAVFLLALIKGQRQFSTFDWSALGVACIALLLWRLTHNPLTALILIIVTDALGFLPTFRKGFHHPFEETISTFAFACVKFAIALFALESFTIGSWLYPASTIVMNGAFVIMLLVRRQQMTF